MFDVKKFDSILKENGLMESWRGHYRHDSRSEPLSFENVFGILMYLYVFESSNTNNNKIRHIKLLRDMTRSKDSVMSLRQSKQVYESLVPHFIKDDRLTDIGFILREDIKSCFDQDLSVLVAKTLLLGGDHKMGNFNDFIQSDKTH